MKTPPKSQNRYETAVARYEQWQERWRDPILTALLVLLSLGIFVGIPTSPSFSVDAAAVIVVWFLLIVAAVLVASRRRIAVATILSSTCLTLITNLLRLDHPSTLTICLGAGSLVVFTATLGTVVWIGVFGPGRVNHHRVRGAVVLYLSIAMLFAALYEILLAIIPGSITGASTQGGYPVLGRSMFYYSLSTLTTTGYGDMLPIHPLARSLSNLEAVIGQLFPATLLARIVTLEMQARRGSAE